MNVIQRSFPPNANKMFLQCIYMYIYVILLCHHEASIYTPRGKKKEIASLQVACSSYLIPNGIYTHVHSPPMRGKIQCSALTGSAHICRTTR